jgi:hypothetical protein
MKFPNKIRFVTDGNEAEFQEIVTHDGRSKLALPRACYVYTKSKTKLGIMVSFSEDEMQKLIDRKIIH